MCRNVSLRLIRTADQARGNIMLLARGGRAHVFKRVSPSLLSPLGTVFGLLVRI